MDYISYALQRFNAGTPQEGVFIGGCRLDKVSGNEESLLDYKNCSLHNDIMRHWISSHQIPLNSYPPPDKITRQLLMQQRYITYEEYLTIFDDTISRTLSRTLTMADKKDVEQELLLFHKQYPAYELFGLADEQQRQIFINRFQPNFKSYCETMKASQTYLATFFFQMV